ncbi:hypothetical protein LCGC14_1498790 [marine sediment metagenome]|uniref:Prokaryotic ubiquitin-like protein Pup n=1 Tax=marine sediment metagenome TaxID=412755 RepID=A0A0F9LKD0_9ZZZZ
MTQTTKNKQATKTDQSSKKVQAKDLKNEELEKSTEEVTDAIDALIEDKTEEIDIVDEIDKILEEDCQSFVANYVQRGGE